MKHYLVDFLRKMRDFYHFYNSTRAYKRVYRNIRGDLFNNTLDIDVIRKYKDKWGVFGRPVEIETFLLCYNLSGVLDLNIVPRNLFATIIEKKLNPHRELVFLELKNAYNKWFEGNSIFPKAYFHKIEGFFYDEEYKVISDLNQYLKTVEIKFPLILKPSKDTSGGEGVKRVSSIKELKENLCNYDFMVCQELISQHEILSKINDSSINSVRVCLYRTNNGRFEILNNSIRFGVDGGLDNTSSGGIVCNIHNNGFLHSYAVDDYANKFYKHPNSDVEFCKVKIPFYEELIISAKSIANEIFPCSLVSLDMCLDDNNSWRCIETNLVGQTISFSQYAGKGFFGKYTDEVILETLKKHI